MDNNVLTMTKRRARVALLIQYFLNGFIFSALLSRMPSIRDYYDMSMAQLGLVLFFMSLGALSTMPLCVYLMGKYGSKKMTVAGYGYMLLLPLLTMMSTIDTLGVARHLLVYSLCAVYGVFVSMLDVAMNGNSIIVENAYRRPIISMFHALYYVGVCFGALLSVVFLTNHISVQAHYLLVTCVSIPLFTIIRKWYLKETITVQKVASKKKILFPQGALLMLAFVALCSRVVEGSVNNWSTVYMKEVVRFADNLAPLGLTMYAAFMSIGRFFCDIIRSKYKETSILLSCCLLASVGVFIIILKDRILFAFLGLMLAGLGISCLVPIIYSLAGRQKEVTPAMGIAMVNTISGTGFLFGPFLIGLIADCFSMWASFAYIWGLTILMTLLALNYRRKTSI